MVYTTLFLLFRQHGQGRAPRSSYTSSRLEVRSRAVQMLGVDRCNSSILQNTMFAAYTLTLVCSLVCSADHNLHHFVRTTSPFEFLVEIPRFMSQVTPGHGHLTFTESLTRVPYRGRGGCPKLEGASLNGWPIWRVVILLSGLICNRSSRKGIVVQSRSADEYLIFALFLTYNALL